MKPLIVALDVETDKEAIRLAMHLRPYVDLFKVGPVLFLKYGSAFIKSLRGTGAEVFLDLKFHDIPSVVRRAIERAGEWGVYSATIHTTGGLEMMQEAARAGSGKRPLLWGVTVLTSLDQKDLRAFGIQRPVQDQVTHLAKMAESAGLDGVIASAMEVKDIKKRCGRRFQVVTPGVRLVEASDDQKRVRTPRQALENGADFFVMGRPIVEAKDPVEAAWAVYQSIEEDGGNK